MADENKLKLLKHRRGQIKAQVTRFTTYLDTEVDESIKIPSKTVKEIEKRLQKIEALYEQFCDIQSQIEFSQSLDKSSDAAAQTAAENEREIFETTFFNIISRAQDIIDFAKSHSHVSNNINQGQISNTQFLAQNFNVKLPPISIQPFSGNYSEFMQFQNTFTSLIHENELLSKTQKFYYLKSFLQGDALKIVQSLDITENNYDIAFDLLKKRYENKRVIINSHLKSIFNLQSINKENSNMLRNFLDTLEKDIKSLKNLKQPVDQWNSILIYLCLSKLDFQTKKEWENSIKDTVEIPPLKQFIDFLNSRCQLLETLSVDKSSISNERPQKVQFSHASSEYSNKIICYLCKGNHCLFYCKRFLDMTPQKRSKECQRLNLCKNCLRPVHTDQCTGQCKKCSYRHNTLLHIDRYQTSSNQRSRQRAQDERNIPLSPQQVHNQVSGQDLPTTSSQNGYTFENGSNDTAISTHSRLINNSVIVLLGTATIYIKDYKNNLIKCRVLLDGGSMSNFMTHELAKKLGLPFIHAKQPIVGVGETLTNVNQSVRATIRSTCSSFNKNLTFLVLHKITGDIPQLHQTSHLSQLKIPSDIVLADPEYYISKPVDILLGASVFYELFSDSYDHIKLGKNKPLLVKTKLGYVLAGPLQIQNNSLSNNSNCFLSTVNEKLDVQKSLERFWEIENVEEVSSSILNKEERFCEDHFLKTHKRDQTGRFEVMLPTKNIITHVPDNFEAAKKRLLTMEHKMRKDKYFSNLYKSFMSEYLRLGHMSEIPHNQINSDGLKTYLPHHGVFKASSDTTKLRVVFDASYKQRGKVSLNDALCVGPVIQDDLFSILVRYRKHNFVFKADITKMYRQVNVHPDHRNLQRILWRENPDEEISHFVLNTVTYGTSPASFLAIRSLHQVALENKSKYPEACNIILNDFYVDDLISGSETQEKLEMLKNQISEILSSAGFILSQWNFNQNHKNQQNVQFTDSKNLTVRTLGILWNPNSDCFQYSVNVKGLSKTLTKRDVLSIISQIFDPLGLIGPVLISAKILLQQLWKLHLDWDSPIPDACSNNFVQFCQDLDSLGNVSVPRQTVLSNYVSIQLHGFTDASMSAYGVCIYLRTTDSSGNRFCQLLCSKSRVSPIKVVSLPRLELCGAVLLTRLMIKCKAALRINFNKSQIHLWTDSEIVLAWLSREPSNWKVFVANRVSEIQKNTDIQSWRHIDSADNPADIVSRGCTPSSLIKNELWWSGPPWLKLDTQFWPVNSKIFTSFENVPEMVNNVALCHTSFSSENFDLFNRYSSFSKLTRITAYCLRFIKNCKSQKTDRRLNNLSVKEIENATLTLIKLVQGSEFAQEISDLKNKGQVSKTSKTCSLSPFLENDILRVGGRLQNSKLVYDNKCPILLPAKHCFTDLIIHNEHIKSLHGGVQTVLSFLRAKYWPINAKSSIKRIIRKCIICFKVKPQSSQPIMGQLPSSRVIPSKPFSSVGIDFAGPVLVKDGTLRSRKLVKTYICVFVCFCTKAVHLELVGDLSSESFLCALKRFIARRGICKNVYSDNGSNFVKADRYLREVHDKLRILHEDSAVQNYLLQNRVTWHFIPPRAPTFGGLWESAVKIMKRHLITVIGESHLTYENLYTILCQIEAVMNSRPLCPISNDPNDLNILTPGHFLIGSQLSSIPEEDIGLVRENRLTKYQQVQQMSLHFWKRWTREYLHNLQQRTKWVFKDPQIIKPGLMVLLMEDNVPPLQWKIGRIIETHPGNDGEIRVVSIKTVNGTFKRSVNKISVLPIEQ